MKKSSLLLFSAFITLSVFANPLPPGKQTTLFEHLNEVNKEWSVFYTPEDLNALHQFENDRQRIQLHLQMVEAHLRNNPPKSLNSKQLHNRYLALDHLKTYYQNACFPQNRYHKERQPYFIDDFGTACAVGQLVIETGHEALAKRVAEENNFAYVAELQKAYPALEQWAKTYGFLMEELAWIQPGYPPYPQKWFALGNGGGVDGHINVMKTYHSNSEYLFLAGNFTAVDDFPAASIIRWDGENWEALGQGLSGEVFDVSLIGENKLFAVGNFYVNENPSITNIAFWQDGGWHAVTENEVIGTIYSIYYQAAIYIGGDFQITTDSGTIQNLAYTTFQDSLWRNADGAFSVNGIVKDFLWNDFLLVAGSFTQTGNMSTDTSILNLDVNGLAYWRPGNNQLPANWEFGFSPDLPTINAVSIKDGWLSAGSDSLNYDIYNPVTAVFSAGIWDYQVYESFNFEDPIIMGFIEYDDVLFTYGNIGNFGGLSSTGLIPVVEANQNSRVLIDGVVRAAAVFQDHLYVAGDFTNVAGQDFEGIAYTDFQPLTSVKDAKSTGQVITYSHYNYISLQYSNLTENINLQFYNLNGNLITSTTLPQGEGETSISTQNWTPGIYVYQAVSKSGEVFSGKVSVMR